MYVFSLLANSSVRPVKIALVVQAKLVSAPVLYRNDCFSVTYCSTEFRQFHKLCFCNKYTYVT